MSKTSPFGGRRDASSGRAWADSVSGKTVNQSRPGAPMAASVRFHILVHGTLSRRAAIIHCAMPAAAPDWAPPRRINYR